MLKYRKEIVMGIIKGATDAAKEAMLWG